MRVGSGRNPLLLALMLTALSGCSIFQKTHPPPAPPPPAPAPQAVATPVETPPIPERKPPPPRATPGTTQAPGPAPPPQIAVLPPPAAETPGTPAPPSIVGLDQISVKRALGAPDTRVDSPPAVIWEYEEGSCMIDVYFYTDIKTGVPHALYVDVKGEDRSDERRQSCLNSFAERAAGDAAGHATDAAAAR